jgi:hypothetical protein
VEIVWIVSGWLTSATIGALIGRINGNVGIGAISGAFLGPLGWLVVACMKDERKEDLKLSHMMKCPRCVELVRKEALICRFCGHEFRPESLKLLSNP